MRWSWHVSSLPYIANRSPPRNEAPCYPPLSHRLSLSIIDIPPAVTIEPAEDILSFNKNTMGQKKETTPRHQTCNGGEIPFAVAEDYSTSPPRQKISMSTVQDH